MSCWQNRSRRCKPKWVQSSFPCAVLTTTSSTMPHSTPTSRNLLRQRPWPNRNRAEKSSKPDYPLRLGRRL
jgi:hypothetical protein